MGLGISIGVLAVSGQDPEFIESFQRHLQEINRVLKANGLPAHEEPVSLPKIPYRGQLVGFPYSWLHYLRRAVAYARQAPDQFCPMAEGESPTEDEKIDNELSMYMDCHFICHSDCDGFYVPLDFPEPLFDDRGGRLSGGILGSSQQALHEVIQAAPLIGIPLVDGSLSDEAAKCIAKEEDEAHPFWIERKVWLTMFEAFRHSVEHGCAVVFT